MLGKHVFSYEHVMDNILKNMIALWILWVLGISRTHCNCIVTRVGVYNEISPEPRTQAIINYFY